MMIQQTPWLEKQFQFNFPVTDFPVIFSRLEGSLFRLKFILSNSDDATTSVSAEGWSVKEEIGHLYDMEETWWKRLQDFQERKEVLTAADMTNQKTTEAGHNGKTIQELLLQFATERQKILETIYDFDKTKLALTSLHPRLKTEMRLVDSLLFVAEHDDHHISKISAKLRKPANTGNH